MNNRTTASLLAILALLLNAGYLIFMTINSTAEEDQEEVVVKLIKRPASLVTYRTSFAGESEEGQIVRLKGSSQKYEVGIMERNGKKRIIGVKPEIEGSTDSVKFAYREELQNVILFVRDEAEKTAFYKIEEDAYGAVRAMPVMQEEGAFDYTSDQRELVFVNQGNIWKLNTDGSALTRLTNSGKDRAPRWSPDQSQIAFTSSRDGNKEVYVMNADGSGQKNITRNPDDDFAPDWSPDGYKIAFTSNRDGDNEIFLVYPRKNRIRQLTENNRSVSHPVWAPDGHKIAVLKTDWKGAKNLFTIGFNGRTIEQLTNFGFLGFGESVYPTWKNENLIEFTNPHNNKREIVQVEQ